ncbi:DUF3443 domain-containing protein [Janthinobacterium sp. NKUCC06_STL]|uniref:DUF3443 domain-containing protein n=1 Tax=Janthinobacterium sp. NKUCC06_STL TaxID=2842127 RepID=UPI001C5AA837|nr:DUF3443 domain-containing protein [Janthinobacterium sp. NKUCC06_STL]MBW3512179.1 DUF3443 domain-containing protein [Janthinobacterium sp. NKUCC06_STL]
MRFLIFALFLLLQACGNENRLDNTAPPSAPLSTKPIEPPTNTVAVVVDSGPLISGKSINTINVPYVSITVCVPGSSTQCQTIDHILLDTGSIGLRIISSALAVNMLLPAMLNTEGRPVVECTQFSDGYSWGSVKQADVRIAGEVARNIPMQIIGDNTFPSVPSGCSSVLPAQNTVETFHANGVLGVAPFVQDCGANCADKNIEGRYYACSDQDCRSTAMPLAKQVSNPVASFQKNNNGIVLQLPEIDAKGVASATGLLTFGIGTQSNNSLGSANIYTLSSVGNLETVYQGRVLQGYFDTGTNALFFADPAIAFCNSAARMLEFYCPSSSLSRSAVNTGTNGRSGSINFDVARGNSTVFGKQAGIGVDDREFIWGLPFFFGRTVYTAIEGMDAAGTKGPYVAY